MAKTKSTKKGKNNVKKKSITKKATYNFKQASPLRKLGIIGFAALFAVVAVIVLKASFAQSPLKPFVDDPARGWVWKGIRKGPANGKCKNLYEVVPANSHESVTCTHGPDPAEPGVDVRALRSTEDLVADTVTGVSGTSSAGNVICVDDGVSGNRVQAVYMVPAGQPDRYNDVVNLIRAYAGQADKVIADSAAKTGGVRHIRFVTDAGCVLNVAHVVATTNINTFGDVKNAMSHAGYNRTDRKYLVWTDHTLASSSGLNVCGQSNLYIDDKPTQDNANNGNNGQVLYGAIALGCWGNSSLTWHMSEVHELTHLLGAVQPSALHGTNGGHCTDEYDELCYNDGALKSGAVMSYPCSTSYLEPYLDCGDDDYFNTHPLAGTYLASHWDIANSSFLTSVGPAGTAPTGTSTPPPPPPPPAGDTTAPTINIISPTTGTTVARKALTAATGADNVAVTKMEIYIDGLLRTTSTGASVSYSWNTRNVSSGAHTIVVKDYDAAGNVGTKTETVYK